MAVCSHFPRCGGCSSIDKPYIEQCAAKDRNLHGLFAAYRLSIAPIIPSPQPRYYRHKVQLPFGTSGRTTGLKPTIGCYASDSHTVVDQSMCLVQDPDLSTIAWTVRDWARETHQSIYNEKTHRGFLRHIVLRKAAGTAEVLIGFVTNGGRPAGSRTYATRLLKMLAPRLSTGCSVVGIVQSVNTRDTNVVLGTEEHVWWGRPYIKEVLGNWRFKIELSTFFQVNPFQTPQLYNEVLRWVPQGAHVLDLYCGVGSISLWVCARAATVTGVEVNRTAIRAAQTAAKLNNVKNVTFSVGDAGVDSFLLAKDTYSVLIVDPPRKGLSNGMEKTVKASNLNRVIYVSCNPETLVRDITLLEPEFKLVAVQGIDMFPATDHIECVAILDRIS